MGLAEASLESYAVEVENGEIFVLPSSALKSAELFADISDSVLDRLDRLACRGEYEAGQSLYNFGDPTDDLYIFESGRVEFLVGRDTHTKIAGFMDRKGEIFGWAALLEQQPYRIAKATCLEKSVLLRLDGKEVLNILASEPVSGYRVMSKLAALITRHLTLTPVNQ
jgi:toluene monooxygenase system ferredoxin subunit